MKSIRLVMVELALHSPLIARALKGQPRPPSDTGAAAATRLEEGDAKTVMKGRPAADLDVSEE